MLRRSFHFFIFFSAEWYKFNHLSKTQESGVNA